ncbi:VMAP-C domain-containing protein [Streptomyces nodosus]|uniref:VMAP-C domain-containing protein n=1 Tax=Streptomyces nodosus TaxID=40318 RepID=UPI00380943E8
MTGADTPRADLFWELAGLVTHIPGLAHPRPLRRSAEAFTERFGPLESERPSGIPREDLYATLRECDRYPEGLRFYLDTLGSGRTGTLAWAAVEQMYLRLYPERLLTPGERDELRTLLGARAPGTRLGPLALPFLPFLPPVDGDTDGPGALEGLLDALEDALVPAGEAHPLLSFVEAVAVTQQSLLEAELRAWSDKVAHHIGCPQEALQRVRAREAARVGRPFAPSRLLVEIVAHPAAPDVYHLRGWLLATLEGPSSLLADCRVTSRGALEETVAALHESVLERLGELSAGLRVEFLLPRPLLWLDVDQFPVRPAGSVARPIGADHTVLVRSRDRFHKRYWWPALHRRLAWLRSNPDGGFEAPAVRYVAPDGVLAPYDLLTELRDGETPFCFVLLEPPQWDGDLAADPVYVLLEVGIPAIVALRRRGHHAEAGPQLWKVLAGRLDALPDRVRHLRGVGPSGYGSAVTLDLHRHVTLVWDSQDGLEGAEAALGHPRTGGGHHDRGVDRPA